MAKIESSSIDWLKQNHLVYEQENDIYNLCNPNIFDGKDRSAFCKAIGGLEHSVEFRRLKDTKQVYSCPDHRVRDRLTHSLEVSNICKQLVSYFFTKAEEYNILEADSYQEVKDLMYELSEFSCLAHDIGHPPFAHTTERHLDKVLPKRFFDSNVQNLRILCKLTPESFGKNSYPIACIDASVKKKHFGYISTHKFKQREEYILEKISKELGTFIEKPIDYEDSSVKKEYFYEKTNKLIHTLNKSVKNKARYKEIDFIRHPVAYFMEASDDISYLSSDIEDALSRGNIDVPFLEEKLLDLILELHGLFNSDESELTYTKDEPLAAPIIILQKDTLTEDKITLPTLDDIKKNYGEYFSRNINDNELSKIKTLILKIFIGKAKWSIVQIIKYAKNSPVENSKPTDKEFLKKLPQWFHVFSLEELKSKVSEPGNLLYFSGKNNLSTSNDSKDFGQILMNFKKSVFNDHLFKVYDVNINNQVSKEVLSHYLESIIPSTLDDARSKAGSMPDKYRSQVYKLLNDEVYLNGDTFDMILDVFIDYLISLSDMDVLNKVARLEEVTKLVSETGHTRSKLVNGH